jgi:multidrug efflux pump subunit AcrA (membrane-fusion protein)
MKNANAATHVAAVAEAQANLGRLLAMKAYATIRAPFAGTVTLRNADIGDLVGPGSTNPNPMFAMADGHRLRVYVSVPQQYAPLMRSGLTARLTAPAWPGRNFTARLVDQSGAINPQTGSLQVQLVMDNADDALRPGGFAQVHFDAGARRTAEPSGQRADPARRRDQGGHRRCIGQGPFRQRHHRAGSGQFGRHLIRPETGREGHRQPARLAA